MRGRAYRRYMERKHKRRLIKIITTCHPKPWIGGFKHVKKDGEWTIVESHIKYPKNSNIQKYLKRQSRRLIRRSGEIPNGNSYKKYMEYKWIFW